MDKTTAISNLANWITANTTGQLAPNPLALSGAGIVFTWNPAPFISTLMSASPSDSPSAVTVVADAWESGINASVLLVPPGTYVGAPTPATIFSVVSSVAILAPTVAAAKAAMTASLLSAAPTTDINQVQIPSILYTAFTSISYSVSGMNTLPPPSGPTPLATVAPML
jgi:hypothetical protein